LLSNVSYKGPASTCWNSQQVSKPTPIPWLVGNAESMLGKPPSDFHLCPPCLQFHSSKTNSKIFRPEDKAFANAWRAYHRQHAGLRLLCLPCQRAVGTERQREEAAAELAQRGGTGE